MGGLCSKRSVVDKSPSDTAFQANQMVYEQKLSSTTAPPAKEVMEKRTLEEPLSFSSDFSFDTVNGLETGGEPPQLCRASSRKFRSSKAKPPASAKIAANKVSEVGSLLGKAGTVGFGKAVEVLDTLGSSMTSLNLSGSFVSGVPMKGDKISILAFEVANTIVKGSNLMESLSKENIKHLKEVVLPSEGVQHLISKDKNELLRISASDKREELKVFSGEVVRFGNRCKDPQWHNLDRYFDKLGSEVTPQKQLKEEVETVMQQLMTLVLCTAELYHELNALDRFEQDYQRKQQEEESLCAAQRGDNLQILKQELKSQRKHVKSLKKKSLWSKILEEVMEKLVDIVDILHIQISDAFKSADEDKPVKIAVSNCQRLGSAGLSLHYANIITQIDSIESRSGLIPKNTKDTLYQSLPPTVKNSLRTKLQTFQVEEEELTVPKIKAKMEKTLRWLVPMANNTSKAHQGFGWVGEWANTGTEASRKPAGQVDFVRLETLHHADKGKTEACIMDLVLWLHHLIACPRPKDIGDCKSPTKPIHSPSSQHVSISTCVSSTGRQWSPSPALTPEDHDMLRVVNFQKVVPGISKSQEFGVVAKSRKCRLTKSSSHSLTSESKNDIFPLRRPPMAPVFSFDIDRIMTLDMIDRVDNLKKI